MNKPTKKVNRPVIIAKEWKSFEDQLQATKLKLDKLELAVIQDERLAEERYIKSRNSIILLAVAVTITLILSIL